VSDAGRGLGAVRVHEDAPDTPPRYLADFLLTELHRARGPERTMARPNTLTRGRESPFVTECVVNALSQELVVEVRRQGAWWRRSFARGVPTSPFEAVGKSMHSGTTLRFTADEELFDTNARFEVRTLRRRLEELAMMVPGVRIELTDERTGASYEIHAPQGALDHVRKRARGRALVAEPFRVVHEHAERCVDLAIAWTHDDSTYIEAFTNGQLNARGGTHIQGLQAGVMEALCRLAASSRASIVPVRWEVERALRGATIALSLAHALPRFRAHPGDMLVSSDAEGFVAEAVAKHLPRWLEAHPVLLDRLLDRLTQP
ncbi:MAG: hypothetical protein AAGI01_17095, partial [Myxococcota bacterium]